MGGDWGWILMGGVFFFQAEDGIRDLVRSRGLGDVYKRQHFVLKFWNPGPKLQIFGWDRRNHIDGSVKSPVHPLSLIHI